jgi:hypothetical protein
MYPVMVVFNMFAGTYDVVLDSRLVLQNESHGVASRGVGSVLFGCASDPDTSGRFFVDAINAFWDGNCASTYDVYVDTSNPPTTLVCDNVPVPYCNPGIFSCPTTYHWKVVETNASGSANSSVWTLNTFCESVPIYIQAFSPVDLIVTDPNNDSIGVSFNTIAGATYSIPNDSVFISEAISGIYNIRVVKDTLDVSGDTTYSVNARIDGTADEVLAAGVPVPGEGESHEYVITSDPPIPDCLSLPGDANADGGLTLADAITTINYIFTKPGCLPMPDCWFKGLLCRGNWNGDGNTTLADVIMSVNYIFNKPGGPWDPAPSEACCLPVP